MKKEAGYDYINPSHYENYSVSAIDMMIRIYGIEATAQYCEMCALKYRLRMGHKPEQPIERELKKEKWLLDKADELRKKI